MCIPLAKGIDVFLKGDMYIDVHWADLHIKIPLRSASSVAFSTMHAAHTVSPAAHPIPMSYENRKPAAPFMHAAVKFELLFTNYGALVSGYVLVVSW